MKTEVVTFEVNCKVCGQDDFNAEVTTRDYAFETCSNEFFYRKCICGHWYLSNQPIESEIPRIYPESYTAYAISPSSLIRKIRKLKSRQHLRHFSLHNNATAVIDYGCGSGEWLSHAREILGDEANLVGIDFSDSGPEILRTHNVSYIQNTQMGQIGSRTVDSCRMIQVIEHLSDLTQDLTQLSRILKIGGRLLIETPIASGWDVKIGRTFMWGGWHAPRHFHIFSVGSLHSILEQCGFEVVSEKYIYGPYVWAETLRARYGSLNPSFANFFSIGNPFCLLLVGFLDFAQRLITRKTSNYRVIAQVRGQSLKTE